MGLPEGQTTAISKPTLIRANTSCPIEDQSLVAITSTRTFGDIPGDLKLSDMLISLQSFPLSKVSASLPKRCESTEPFDIIIMFVFRVCRKETDISVDVSPVYIFPGIYGDKQELVEFRNRLSDRVPVEIIELQSLEGPLADLISMEAIGAAVAREIDRRRPDGSLRLAGYSFGGSVAFEAARRLIHSGRSVCFLGLIDVIRPRSPAHNAQQGWWGGRPLRLLRKIYAGRNLGFRVFVYRLLQELLGRFCSSDSRRRCVLSMTTRFWPSCAGFVRRLLLFFFRRQAIENWRPVPVPGAVFLAISQENSYSIDQWMCLCPQGSVVQLPGKHVHVFKSPSLEVLLLAFEKAVRNADFRKPLPS